MAAFSIMALAGDASGSAGNTGDGGPSAAATFDGPSGIAVVSDGTVFLADYNNHKIRMLKGGTVTTIAGWGAFGFAGDGGAATDAQLNHPFSVAVASGGGFAIADYGNNRVRLVDKAGMISTIAGGGSDLPSATGSATASALVGPAGVSFDNLGNLYIAEFGGNRIDRVDITGRISVVAGTGTAGFAGDGGAAANAQLNLPVAVLPDGAGGLYLADYGNHRVREVDSKGYIKTVAGTGTPGSNGDGQPAATAQLNGPTAMAIGPDGTLYIADSGNNKIRAITSDGVIHTIAGTGSSGNAGDNGPATSAQLNNPLGLALYLGNPLVADFGNNRLRTLIASNSVS